MSVAAAHVALLVAAGCAHGQSTPDFSLDLSRLTPDSARFAFIHQDQQVGETAIQLTSHDGLWTFRERTEVPAGFQETTVTFGPGPTMRQVEQRGRMGPSEIVIDVTYSEGRAKGRAIVPAAAGLDSIEVDAAVPDGVIDDNVLLALFPAMALTPGMTFSLPVFSSGKNETTVYEFAAEVGPPVDWMGERVETLEVETSGAVELSYVVAARAPHRVFRIEPPGPMTIRRMEPTQ